MIPTTSNNKLSSREINSALEFDHGISEDTIDGKTRFIVTETYNSGLADVDEFVAKVLKSKRLAYNWTMDQKSNRILKKLPLSKYSQDIDRFSIIPKIYPPDVRFSENIQLFLKCHQNLNLETVNFNISGRRFVSEEENADLFNSLITNIREEAKTKEFKDSLKVRVDDSRRRFKSNKKYVNALIEKHSKILVLRVDFYYLKQFSSRISIEAAHKDRKRFLNNTRQNSLFENLLGFIWKLEYKKQRGPHFHLMLFFNGQEHRNHAWLADEVGKYWSTRIVPGRGHYHNCNRDEGTYWNRGIGMLNRFDTKMRNDLFIAIQYLTKKDQYFMVKTGRRTIGKSEMPTKRISGPGRPRKEAQKASDN